MKHLGTAKTALTSTAQKGQNFFFLEIAGLKQGLSMFTSTFEDAVGMRKNCRNVLLYLRKALRFLCQSYFGWLCKGGRKANRRL